MLRPWHRERRRQRRRNSGDFSRIAYFTELLRLGSKSGRRGQARAASDQGTNLRGAGRRGFSADGGRTRTGAVFRHRQRNRDVCFARRARREGALLSCKSRPARRHRARRPLTDDRRTYLRTAHYADFGKTASAPGRTANPAVGRLGRGARCVRRAASAQRFCGMVSRPADRLVLACVRKGTRLARGKAVCL